MDSLGTVVVLVVVVAWVAAAVFFGVEGVRSRRRRKATGAGPRFRWWGWIGVVLSAFGIFGLASGEVVAALSIVAIGTLAALTGLQPAIAPWWSLLGWALVVWGATAVLIGGNAVPPLAYVLVAVGLALGVVGIVVNALTSR